MRFLADENVSRIIADARAEDRSLITGDHDFGEMVIRQRLAVNAVILLELDRLPSAAAAAIVARVLQQNGDRLIGRLVVIEPARVRIRPLPR